MPVDTADLLALAAFIFAETEWGAEEDEADIPAPLSRDEERGAAAAQAAEGGGRWVAR